MRTVSQYLWRYKIFIFIIFSLVLVQSFTQLLLPTLMGDIVDNGVVKGDIPYIWKVGALMLFIAALGVIMSVTISHISAKVAMSVGRDLRNAVFSKVIHYSLEQLDQFGTSSLITRTTNDVTQIQQASVIILRMFLMAPFMLIGGLVMAFSKDITLSFVIVVAIPIIVLFVAVMMKIGFPLFQAIQVKIDHMNKVFRENLTGIRVVRAFNKEPTEKKRLEAANIDLMDVSVKVNRLMAFTMPFLMLLMNLTVVFVIWFGGIRIELGAMQIGDLMAYVQYCMLIMFAVMMASMLFVIIPRAAVSAGRVEEVLLEDIQLSDGDSNEIEKQTEILSFKDVVFYYEGAEEPALEHITFQIHKGETVAIIGGTGSGKTTLINLIPKFFQITVGDIQFHGKSINELTRDVVRENIGLVPQKANLFSGTIADNIRYGKEDATEKEIEHAIEIAQAAEFVHRLEDGIHTNVEQGGANLSGGQKQRLAIARAIIRKPSLYIFDDSFSALDYATDAKLRQALLSETKEAAVLVVAQRVNTVIHADQIIVLDKGKMVGKGTHKQLLKENDVYREIVVSQMGEEAIE